MSFSFHLLLILLVLSICNFVLSKPNSRKNRIIDDDLSDISHIHDDEHDYGYDHEAFLGRKEAKSFDDMTPEESKESLGVIYDKIDSNHDNKVSKEEMSAWIKKVSQKMMTDDANNIWEDHGLQADEKLTWDKHLEETFGLDGEYAGDEETKKKMIIKDERRWKFVDADHDGKLSKEEFFLFIHPEHFPNMRDIIIKETLEDVDKNNDGYIDLEEYTNDLWTPTTPNEVEPEWVNTERQQFAQKRDKDGDGKLNSNEIGDWIMPEDFDHVQSEVKHLFSESDVDQNGFLTKKEVLDRYDLFVGSQATVFGEILSKHDEL